MDHYNPKNPFVANEYFFVNVNNHPFAESTFAVVHRVNNLVSGLVATIASLLLLYCALYRSPWNFRYYSKMIILGVFIDMCQTMSNLWCQVRFRVSDLVLLMALNGPSNRLSPVGQCLSYIPLMSSIIMASCILPLQYYFRWHIIKRKTMPSRSNLTFCVLSILLICFILCVLMIPGYCEFLYEDFVRNYDLRWYPETPIPLLITADFRDAIVIAFLTTFALVIISSYLLAIWFARDTVRSLSSIERAQMTKRALELQNEFARTLFIQSITPLFTIICPMLVIMLLPVFDIRLVNPDYLMIIISWQPAINSISILCIIVHYRNYVKQLFCCELPKSNQTSTVIVFGSTSRSVPSRL